MKNQSLLHDLSLVIIMSSLLALGTPAHAQLDILLTNDDGFGEPGIEALKTQLRAAGHTVTVGAPDGNTSGAAASLDLTRPFVQVICPQSDECKVRSVCFIGRPTGVPCTALGYLGPATPAMSIAATSAAVGKDFSDFDLIVSGINNGTNLGPVAQFSGTIGATIAAITKIGANTPGIAVSMPEHPVNATVDDAAAFVVTLVGQLADNLGRWHDTLLPAGVALSINYPDLAFDDLTGVKLTVQGRLDLVGPGVNRVFRAQLIDPTHMLFAPTRVEKPTDDVEVPNADTTAFAQGFITITPVAADDTTRETARQQVQRLLRHIVRE